MFLDLKEEEINTMFDCGFFNTIVEGAVIDAMQHLDYSEDEIRRVVSELSDTFDGCSAEQLRAKRHRF